VGVLKEYAYGWGNNHIAQPYKANPKIYRKRKKLRIVREHSGHKWSQENKGNVISTLHSFYAQLILQVLSQLD
jgi:hypothetical protein